MLVFGLQSRFAALMLFSNMAVAVKFHFFDPFCAVKALPMSFMGIYAFLAITGGGRFSLDNLIFAKFKDAKISEVKNNYALRIGMMLIAFGNFFSMGGTLSAVILFVAFAIFVQSIYGFGMQR